MPKAAAVFDADDSRPSSALARINLKMLALQSRIAKVAAAGVETAGFDHFKQALDVGGRLNDLSADTGTRMIGPSNAVEKRFTSLRSCER